MYNVDDAIAKIDGYVISISGGGPFVGESKLIRIDEVQADGGLREHGDRATGCPARWPTTSRADDVDERRGPSAADAEQERDAGRRPAAEDGGEAKVQSNGSTGKTPPWPPRRPAAFARCGERQLEQARPMAYAIIDIGGKQYRVEKGDSVVVDRVGAETRARRSTPRAVLYADGKTP